MRSFRRSNFFFFLIIFAKFFNIVFSLFFMGVDLKFISGDDDLELLEPMYVNFKISLGLELEDLGCVDEDLEYLLGVWKAGYLAYFNGLPVGFLLCTELDEVGNSYLSGGDLEIETYVCESFRNRGIGGILKRKSFELVDLGSKVFSFVRSDNLGNISLLEKCGFKDVSGLVFPNRKVSYSSDLVYAREF